MNTLFYIFSFFAIICSCFVIQSQNPVHSVLFLILVFFQSTGLLILMGLDFFSFIFLIIYVGAITTLFLFVVMMLNIKFTEINEKKLRYLPIGGLLGLMSFAEIFLMLNKELVLFNINDTNLVYLNWKSTLTYLSNIEAVGSLIYTYYFNAFILASLILLVAMVGAIMLTLEKSSFVKRQNIYDQTTREYSKTVINIR
uniref:NADH-ubiquinone oxidoreductase chain 6 n=1 Tax=Symbiochloris sp. SG-2018 TaxID=2126034 RepID=A0A976U6N8_9CHLO|nr:NADH dehydrogenase subunit 6 [Symbiochloris sp. SG-2018]UVF37874.1 NADH dehydrogenase subunit 6 [Symbiochloris sp. SG-2018]